MKNPIPYTYDLNTKSAQKVICVTHTDDNSVDVIQLHVVQGGALIDFSGNTIIARMVMSRTHELLSDNVVCEIDEATKDVMIPIDRKAVSTRKGLMLIEVNVRGVLPEKLTLQFPLLVRVNGSILDDAEITPESQGTIPELLEEVKEELERVKDFATAEDVFEILDSALEGNPSVAPTLLIDNTVDQQFNPDGHWILYYIDSDDIRHNIFDFSNLPSGTSDYTDLQNKPQINSHTLSGNKSSDDLGLQKKLTAGTNITIANDGTISASGGVTSYNDLTDKPVIMADDNSGTVPSWPLLCNLLFNLSDFEGLTTNYGNDIRISIKSLFSKFHFETYRYDFNRIGMTPYNGTLQFKENSTIQNFPTALNRIDRTKTFYIYQAFDSSPNGGSERTLLRKAFGRSANGEYLEYAQLCYVDFYDGGNVTSQTDWLEIGSGSSQIVSGVVNQNGTITFTDSDGNTFTTTGSSVIGADGFSPTATVTQTQSGATVTITDRNGTTTANISNGADGQDYVLTAQDKSDIADIVLGELPNADTMSF